MQKLKFSNKKLQLLSNIHKIVFKSQGEKIPLLIFEDSLVEKNYRLGQKCLLTLKYNKGTYERLFSLWASDLRENEKDLMIARFILLSSKKQDQRPKDRRSLRHIQRLQIQRLLEPKSPEPTSPFRFRVNKAQKPGGV